MARKKRSRGHFCWCCERVLPNERFSGRGHGTHLCRRCARLPLAERERRQALVDFARYEWAHGRRKRRAARGAVEQHRDHPDPEIRALARGFLEHGPMFRAMGDREDDIESYEDSAAEEPEAAPTVQGPMLDHPIPF